LKLLLDLGIAQVVEHLPGKHEAPSSKLKQYEKRFLKYCDRSQVPKIFNISKEKNHIVIVKRTFDKNEVEKGSPRIPLLSRADK
jgi:hypothetical protein